MVKIEIKENGEFRSTPAVWHRLYAWLDKGCNDYTVSVDIDIDKDLYCKIRYRLIEVEGGDESVVIDKIVNFDTRFVPVDTGLDIVFDKFMSGIIWFGGRNSIS